MHDPRVCCMSIRADSVACFARKQARPPSMSSEREFQSDFDLQDALSRDFAEPSVHHCLSR